MALTYKVVSIIYTQAPQLSEKCVCLGVTIIAGIDGDEYDFTRQVPAFIQDIPITMTGEEMKKYVEEKCAAIIDEMFNKK